MSRARRSRYAWGLALCISGAASAQTRPEPRPVAPPALCTLVRSNSLAFAAPAPAPNAQTQLQLASTATGAIVAFRARTSDELVVLRVDDSFVRVGEDRVVAGPVTAFVKLECSFFQRDYVDFLTLIRVNEQWKIISKVFHYQPAA